MTTQAAFEQVLAEHRQLMPVVGGNAFRCTGCDWLSSRADVRQPDAQHRAHVAAALAAAGVGDGLSEGEVTEWVAKTPLTASPACIAGGCINGEPDPSTCSCSQLAARTPGLADEGLRERVEALNSWPTATGPVVRLHDVLALVSGEEIPSDRYRSDALLADGDQGQGAGA